MKFKKIYIEITNVCNFACSFCFKTSRGNKFISVDEFGYIIKAIVPYTNYVYLHVLGEPLLHPQLNELLAIAETNNIQVNITTNGSLVERKQAELLNNNIRQLNISLHDAEENIPDSGKERYINSVLHFATQIAPKTYVNLRLWNSGVKSSEAFIQYCKTKIAQHFEKPVDEFIRNEKDSGIKLADHVFLQTAPRFDWPDGETARHAEFKTCYALRDQLAILVDGTVVPCCIDADGALKLGNIFEQSLDEILQSERAQKIRNGFINNKITEDFCKSCGFFADKKS